MSLRDLAVRYDTDKAAHGYCPLYERHLGYLRGARFTLLEIGVAAGGSLRMWRDYFKRADIVGIDRNPHTMLSDEHRILTICDDAAIPRPWRHSGIRPTVIIDDGGHGAEEVVGAWTWTWPMLEPGGWYVVEDVGAQFCREFGGSDPDGSVATALLTVMSVKALRGQDVAEFHAYQELALFKKAGG